LLCISGLYLWSFRLFSINDTFIPIANSIFPIKHCNIHFYPQLCNCLAFSPTKPEPNPIRTTLISGLNTSVISHQPKDTKFILPNIVAGYSDGTVRMFDLNKVEMVLKMQPHAVAVTAISFSTDGR